ncbi:hypothetical protein BTA51_27160 [Hahella sp. CCB-MM4]|uniref:hypothetical protein n=1 Tax=Hahella sp. (strain CCB-MM4) TaxID=1926491 RepID=UPI000B9BB207|nr:hypothetical protein [Hahella sp. CCB-MM4]OZG70157.1 hypothetical protein BTA51_27160 [Hahella sp. CCB-MM4]
MNVFKLFRLFYVIEFIKVFVFSALSALTPWAVSYVLLSEYWQPYTSLVYWGSFLLFGLGFSRIAIKFKKEIDDVVNPAEILFESFTKVGSKDPEERKKAAANLVKVLSDLEGDEPDEEEEMSEEERLQNKRKAFAVLHKLEALCRRHNLNIQREDDRSLEDIARDYEYHTPQIKEALAEILPNYRASLWVEVEDDEGTHAEVMSDLIRATNNTLGISQIRSIKDQETQLCVVEFQQNGKDMRWKFREPGYRVSENFLTKVLHYISKLADGRFVFIDGEDSCLEYLFIPTPLHQEITALNKQKKPQESQ